YVLDRAVFSSGVHGLENEQHRPAVLCIQHVLQLSQRFNPHGECVLGARLVLGAEAEGFAGIDILQAKLATVRHSKRFREISGRLMVSCVRMQPSPRPESHAALGIAVAHGDYRASQHSSAMLARSNAGMPGLITSVPTTTIPDG